MNHERGQDRRDYDGSVKDQYGDGPASEINGLHAAPNRYATGSVPPRNHFRRSAISIIGAEL